MKKSLLGKSLVLLWVILLMVSPVFGQVDFKTSIDQNIGSYNQDSSFSEAELIVSIEGSSRIGTQGMETQSIAYESTINNLGYRVKDVLHKSKDPNRIQIMSMDAVQKMGHVYLVGYDTEQMNGKTAADHLKKQLESQGLNVKYVEINQTLHAIGNYAALATHPNQNWHYDMINVTEAWALNSGSYQTKMAVLDTGIDHNHESLRNLVDTSLGKNFTGGSTTDTMDRQSHGTHVAGTIASYNKISGVMEKATLIPVKVLGDDGNGSLYGIQEGILYASSIGADVINMSLGGGGYSQAMNDACETAVARGTVVVAATGNDGSSSISYPAAYPSVIAVGSVDQYKQRSSFSQYGTGVDIMAPGSDIYSSIPNNGYATYSGTSMATPHLAGVAGLVRSANPSLSVAEVRNILKTTTQYVGSSYQYGSGLVDAEAAVLKALGGTPVDKVTSTSILLNKDTVNQGGSVIASIQVKDQDNNPLSGVNVNLLLTDPKGQSLEGNKTSDSQGKVSFTLNLEGDAVLGDYLVKATSSLSGYTSSQASSYFEVTGSGQVVTVVGYEVENKEKWTSKYYWWRIYNVSADVYIVLSDGTRHFHGKESNYSYYGYPSISKTISGTALSAANDGVPYELNIYVTF